MKGIYKKISVGVLAAALLVGGSGVLQGGQAFADFDIYRYEVRKEEQYNYRKLAREDDKNRGYGWFERFDREKNRLRVVYLLKDYLIQEAIEIRELKESKIKFDKEYSDGWYFKCDIEAGKFKKGEKLKVKIGSLLFEVKI